MEKSLEIKLKGYIMIFLIPDEFFNDFMTVLNEEKVSYIGVGKNKDDDFKVLFSTQTGIEVIKRVLPKFFGNEKING